MKKKTKTKTIIIKIKINEKMKEKKTLIGNKTGGTTNSENQLRVNDWLVLCQLEHRLVVEASSFN